MRVLFDQGPPVPLRRFLPAHEVVTLHERGWSTLRNGQLLDTAENEAFDVLVTTDSKLQYQQDLKSRRIAVVVIRTTSWPRIRLAVDAVVSAVDAATAGSYVEVDIP